MELWFDEMHTPNMRLGFRIKMELEHMKSEFQDIHVFDTYDYGKLLVIDGTVQLTERDEFVYHEMISHPPLLTHPDPKRILIIGGGDGGTAREVLKHGVEDVHVVDIDKAVVDISRRYFPEVSSSYEDPRVKLHIEDGVEYVKREGNFDIIIVDSTDPVGKAVGLFEEDFYRNVKNALNPGGVVVQQSGTPIYHMEEVCGVLKNMRKFFTHAALYLAFIPTYPSGMWAFTMGSDEPLRIRRGLNFETRYFSEELYLSPLPEFVKKGCKDE